MKSGESAGRERFKAALAQYQKFSKLPYGKLESEFERVRTEFLEVALERIEKNADPEAFFWSCYVMLEDEAEDREKMLREVKSVLRENIQAGHIPSLWMLASLLTGSWPGIPEPFISRREGKMLMALAARKNYHPAMTAMLHYYRQQLTRSTYYEDKAFKLAEKLAAENYPSGYLYLGECALQEDGPGEKGPDAALAYFEKAYEFLSHLDFVERHLEGRIKYRLGVCYYNDGQTEEGVRLIREAERHEEDASCWLAEHGMNPTVTDETISGKDSEDEGSFPNNGHDENDVQNRELVVIKLKQPFSFQIAMDKAIEEKKKAEFSPEEIEDILKPLNALTGLFEVKDQIRELVQYAQIIRRRRQAGLGASALGLHMVFSGNPGTGKTTVARIVGKILTDLGFLSTGNFIEVDRSGLVGEYIGETAQKTRNAINNARGGILFIDEAHALVHSSEKDYGWEAVDTLVKAMEDRRDDFVVIAAGYKGEIEHFINANTGLASRFTWHIDFPDYGADDIVTIFENMCSEADYNLSAEAAEKLRAGIKDLARREGRKFSNGRTARKLFETTIRAQAKRLMQDDVRDKKALALILPEDIRFDFPVSDGTVTFLPKK